MESLADYIARIIRLESEGEVSRVGKDHNPSEQDSGRDAQRVRDQGRLAHGHQSDHRQVGPTRDQDRPVYERATQCY